MMALVGFLTLKGSDVIERVLTAWSFLLYVTYGVFATWAILRFGPEMAAAVGDSRPGTGWGVNGLRYAAYNIGILPAVLFVLRGHESRRLTLGAGLLVGPLAMVPALLVYVSLLAAYPAVLERDVPVSAVLEALGSGGFTLLFQVVLLGTLVETGTGLIHAVNERIAHAVGSSGRPYPRWGRPALAVGLLGVASSLSAFGLVGLIARGYGTITWVFLIVFVIPVVTLGGWRVITAGGE